MQGLKTVRSPTRVGTGRACMRAGSLSATCKKSSRGVSINRPVMLRIPLPTPSRSYRNDGTEGRFVKKHKRPDPRARGGGYGSGQAHAHRRKGHVTGADFLKRLESGFSAASICKFRDQFLYLLDHHGLQFSVSGFDSQEAFKQIRVSADIIGNEVEKLRLAVAKRPD